MFPAENTDSDVEPKDSGRSVGNRTCRDIVALLQSGEPNLVDNTIILLYNVLSVRHRGTTDGERGYEKDRQGRYRRLEMFARQENCLDLLVCFLDEERPPAGLSQALQSQSGGVPPSSVGVESLRRQHIKAILTSMAELEI